MVEENLGARLRAFREAKGLTKYRLAKVSRVSQTYIYRIEKGEIKNPRRDTLQSLARGLNITLAQLAGDTSPQDAWTLVEQSLKAYIPVYTGVYEVGMDPVDYVVCTRVETPSDTVRGYRIEGLCLGLEIRGGDTLIVDSALAPVTNDLLLVSMMGEVTLGRYSESDGIQWFEDNRGRHKITEDVTVHGVITEYVRKLR